MTHVDELVVDIDERVDTVLDNTSALLETVDSQAARLGDEVAATTAEIRELSGSLETAADELAMLVDETRPGLREFTNVGLQEVTLTLSELRLLAQSLSRLVVRLEQGGTPNLLFGASDQGVTLE
jgi:ABC-type transporter Mla subunit MlaD